MIVEVLRYYGASVPDRAGRFAVEQWKPVPFYEGRYEVSDLGRVRSLVNNHGEPRSVPLILSLASNHGGYSVVSLSDGCGRRQWRVSRLVLRAFRGDPGAGETASHLNGDRRDNRLVNLVWETQSQNILRKHLHGTGRNQWGAWKPQ